MRGHTGEKCSSEGSAATPNARTWRRSVEMDDRWQAEAGDAHEDIIRRRRPAEMGQRRPGGSTMASPARAACDQIHQTPWRLLRPRMSYAGDGISEYARTTISVG